jgi:MFS family permease
MNLSVILNNRSFLGLLGANTVLGTAMPMLIILGGLAGYILAPSVALATLPASLQTLAGLLAAAPFSLFMGRFGRRAGFLLGGVFAMTGSVGCVLALLWGNFVMLCLAHMMLGAALVSYQYFRFAAAEVVSRNWQPVAISLMLTSGLVAALIGPQVFIALKDALTAVPLVGAYLGIAGLTLIGLLPLLFVDIAVPEAVPGRSLRAIFAGLRVLLEPQVRTAVGMAAVAQGVMVFMMTPTPLAMISCGLSEIMAGDVIRWHVVAMFAPSFFTGFLIQRFGTQRICITGLALLIIAAVAAASGQNPLNFYSSLILLGIGWNFAFIGATTMLASAVAEDQKSVVQGANDTLIALVSTVCAFAAGGILHAFGWATLSLVALGIVIATLGALVWERRLAV